MGGHQDKYEMDFSFELVKGFSRRYYEKYDDMKKECGNEGLHFDQNFIKLFPNLSFVVRNDIFCQIQMRSWRLEIEVNVYSDQVFFVFQACCVLVYEQVSSSKKIQIPTYSTKFSFIKLVSAFKKYPCLKIDLVFLCDVYRLDHCVKRTLKSLHCISNG